MQLLDLNTRAHDYCAFLKMKVQVETDSDLQLLREIKLTGKHSFTYLRAGDLLSIEGGATATIESMPETSPNRFRELIDDHIYLYTCIIPSEETAATGHASHQVMKYFASKIGDVNYGGAMDGFYPGTDGRQISELMKNASGLKLRPQEEVVGRHLCHVLEAKAACGSVTLWLLKGRNLIKKCLINSGQEDAYGSGMTMLEFNNSEEWPFDDKLGTLSTELVNHRYGRVNGVWVPVEASVTQRMVFSSGKRNIGVYHYHRSELEINPSVDRPRDFSVDFPDGSEVENLDDRDSRVRYVLREGRIVPSLSP